MIIKEGYNPDQYDTALANFIGSFFPGRANKVVGRAHLANVNRAATKGYSYRLLENGFISNHEDLNKFNSQIDDLARGILKAFGITSAALVASVKKTEPVDGEIKSGGEIQNKTDKFGTISYQAHMRGFGWGNWQSDGLMVGSTGQNRRIIQEHQEGHTDRNHRTEQKTGSNPDHRKGIFLPVQSPPEEYWLVRMGQQRRVGWYDRKRTADGSTGD